MITAGVDLASQAAKTAISALDWSASPVRVTALVVGVEDAEIAELVGAVDKLGIDVPLGWPLAFSAAVAQHARDGSWPSDYLHAESSAFRFRETDLSLWRSLGTRPPLSVSTDRIALPAIRAAALLSRLPERVELDGSGVVVEVYPAAALRRWGLPSQGYKHKEHLAERGALLARLCEQTAAWLLLSEAQRSLCSASDDAFDALIAALVARAAALGLVDPIATNQRAAARREGWIALPTEGSLALARRRRRGGTLTAQPASARRQGRGATGLSCDDASRGRHGAAHPPPS